MLNTLNEEPSSVLQDGSVSLEALPVGGQMAWQPNCVCVCVCACDGEQKGKVLKT